MKKKESGKKKNEDRNKDISAEDILSSIDSESTEAGDIDKKDNVRNSGGKMVLDKNDYDELLKRSEERDEYYKKWMQVHAEYENTRKRMEKEKTDRIRFANEDIIMQLLPLIDNFDLALAAMEKAEDKMSVMEGIKLVAKEFHRVLEDNGVEKVKVDGEDFDPNVHEAVFAVETDEYPENTIVGEVRSGYKLRDRLVRPAQVKVAKPVEEIEEE